jgi:hypothetical protein
MTNIRECSIVERYSTCSALYLVDFTRGIFCLSLHFLTLSEKEIYLLIGAVLGAAASLITTKINPRSQLTLARENQSRIEEQKLAHQQQKERRKQPREKLEEAHQLLSKIRTETTPGASRIMRKTGMTYSRSNIRRATKTCVGYS